MGAIIALALTVKNGGVAALGTGIYLAFIIIMVGICFRSTISPAMLIVCAMMETVHWVCDVLAHPSTDQGHP
jgi:hypothetical protein